jgi:hypothetical protein
MRATLNVDPAFTWSCEHCGTSQLGPEWPGYRPHCISCGNMLTKTAATTSASPAAPVAPPPSADHSPPG